MMCTGCCPFFYKRGVFPDKICFREKCLDNFCCSFVVERLNITFAVFRNTAESQRQVIATVKQAVLEAGFIQKIEGTNYFLFLKDKCGTFRTFYAVSADVFVCVFNNLSNGF